MLRLMLVPSLLLCLIVLTFTCLDSNEHPPAAATAADGAEPMGRATQVSLAEPPPNMPTSLPDDRPLPETEDSTPPDWFQRTIGEHFRSHPSTESRIVRLRQLADRQVASPQYTEETNDWLDVAVDVKNRSAHLATLVFAEVVGPMSLEEEWQKGQQIHDQLLSEMKVDRQATERLQPLMSRLQTSLTRTRGQRFTLTVIEDETVNAFSHLGGHIYVCQGLLDLAKSDNELLFVIGHELAHIELGHCVLGATGGAIAEKTLGQFAGTPARLLQKVTGLSYSEHDEYESDAWSYHAMRRLGKTDRDTTDFFYTLLAYSASQAQSSTQGKTSNGR